MYKKPRFSRKWLGPVALIVIIIVLFLGNYLDEPVSEIEIVEEEAEATRILMDTTVNIRVYGQNPDQIVHEAFTEIERLEAVLSRHITTSEVAAINAQPGEWVEVSDETLEVVSLGLELGALTNSSFDITVGGLIDLWGFGTGNPQVPHEEELASVLETVDYRLIEVDADNNLIRVPPGTILDLGGIAKGYIVDRAHKLLEDNQVKRGLINAGGDISALGTRPDGNPWRVGVQNPDNPSEIQWVLPLENVNVVTSGDYQRYFVQNDERYHHILDPSTGYPAREIKSVTVVAAEAAVGDAFSTAVFILGMDAGRELVLQTPNVEAIIVTVDDDVWISPGLESIVYAP